MRLFIPILLLLILSQHACVREPDEMGPVADRTLDDLSDKTDYLENMLIDCSFYKGLKVEKLLVNGILHDTDDVLELEGAGFYRIEIFQGRIGQAPTDLIRIVILDPERGNPEWGLPPWTPREPVYGAIGDLEPDLVYTRAAPAGAAVPLVILMGEQLTSSDLYLNAALGSTSFRIKRGVGSVQVQAENHNSMLQIDSRDFELDISIIQTPSLQLSGVLEADLQVPAGSHVHISDELTIPEGISLEIGSGSFITLASGINVINNGSLSLAGSAGEPVTITCSDKGAYWGGFIGRSSGNRIEASYTIFSRSGHNTGGEYAYGHAGRQALFYSENGELVLDHCFMIDHVGQIFYPLSCRLELTECLVQRAKTGGQMNQSEVFMDRCLFTDFPDDSEEYRDEDNDGLYLNECNAYIANSVFMYAKDDGLDSGASGGGEVQINSCRFEANYHEGAALSSGNPVTKLHHIRNSVFTNNGQGLELGYSSSNHQVIADSCVFLANGVGIRFGDCYDWGVYRGNLLVQNSLSLENTYHDVWNMNRRDWAADTSHMSFLNVYVSKPNPMYPELLVYE